AGGSISYASPTQYHQQSFQGRPSQTLPIQPPPQNDLRSPHRSFSVQSKSQSPYPLAHPSATTQYLFPQHQTPQSPAQHHPYPPHFPQRDSYPQSNLPIHPQHQNSFPQQSPTPQTPPIGLPGATHPYLHHQRSVSSVSTETPSSAHSQQQQYFNQYSQDSPVSAGPYPTSQTPQHRPASQQSQSGTALGPPLTPRQPSGSGSFAQPQSPYQQRGVSSAPLTQLHQTSPKPPAPQSIQRLPSTPSAYDSQRTSLSEQQRRPDSERDRSVSVSPKTRLPSQPRGEITTPQFEKDSKNSTKRKLEDREMAVEEPRRMDSTDTRPQVNGNHRVPSSSPQPPPKKRNRYTEPPIWAQSIRNKALPIGRGPVNVNVKPPQAIKPVHAPQTQTNGSQSSHPTTINGKAHPSALLGPWEPSITGVKPVEQVTKLVADFLYVNVISRGDLGELASRGVEIEIEAKLGHIVDKETSQRYRLPVSSECVLMTTNRVRFESSMTESQHCSLNGFLNAKLGGSKFSQNPGATSTGRVEIKYKHSREVDSFYELPKSMYSIIPPALREKIPGNHSVKVRVTHDQKSREVKAKIIKARICDLDILNPQTPLDCRISINFEMRFDGDIEELGRTSGPERNKDRLSYTQSMYQIDLTQVTQQVVSAAGIKQTVKEHELEIELLTAAVQDQGQKAVNGEPNEYLSLVEGFIDNMRVLSRATPAS
ncbi:mRNA capping enzyme, partial [Diplocarpon rosae]